MPRLLTETALLAFKDEMSKLAINPLLGSAAALGGVGALAGGGLSYLSGKAQGKTTGEAIRSAGGGALRGGLIGTGAGALAGLHPGMGQALSNFGQRQVHGLTGWTPKAGLHSIGGGAAGASERLSAAARRFNPADPKAMKDYTNAVKSYTAAHEAERMGLTNLPGFVKSMASHPLDTLRAGTAEALHGQGGEAKALLVGLPALGVAHAATHDAPEGQTKAENIGYQTGQLVGGIASGPLSFLGQMGVGEAFGRAGKAVGRGISRLRGTVPNAQGHPTQQSTDLTNTPGQHTPSEVQMTDRAMGNVNIPEGFG